MSEYDTLKTALAALDIPFAEDAWTQRPGPPYGVYALENATRAIWADDCMAGQALSGSIDVFSLEDTLELRHTIERTLNACGISWAFNSHQYEDDTRLHHLEWVFEAYEAAEEEADPDEDEDPEDPEDPDETEDPEDPDTDPEEENDGEA